MFFLFELPEKSGLAHPSAEGTEKPSISAASTSPHQKPPRRHRPILRNSQFSFQNQGGQARSSTLAPVAASGPGKGKPRDPEEEGDTVTISKPRVRTKRPPMYKVIFHNDHYTTQEFVVFVLQHIFNHSESTARRVMLQVHHNGAGVAGVYTYEIAETKVQKTHQLARAHEFPLKLTMEPES